MGLGQKHKIILTSDWGDELSIYLDPNFTVRVVKKDILKHSCIKKLRKKSLFFLHLFTDLIIDGFIIDVSKVFYGWPIYI